MGLDPKVLLDVLNNSSARSWSTEVYCPVPGLVPTAPSSRDYENGFKNELMVKVWLYNPFFVVHPFGSSLKTILPYMENDDG